MLIGESRGAMVGMGVLALDKVFNQDVRFADLTAPCFPRKFKLSDVLLLSSQIIREPISTAQLARKLTSKRLIHYPGTVDLNPYSVAHQLAMTLAIFSGEAGEMAKLIDDDKICHITSFQSDKASMLNHWRGIFKNHANVRITPLPGSHLTLADPETHAYIMARGLAFHESEEAISRGDLLPSGQADYVFDLAHHKALELLG